MTDLRLLILVRRALLALADLEGWLAFALLRPLALVADAADHLAGWLIPAVRLPARVEARALRGVDRLAETPAGRAVRRVHGAPRPGAAAEAWRDLGGWVRADRVLPIALVWAVVLVWLLTSTSPTVLSQAAQLTYLLIALVGLHLLLVDAGQPSLGHAAFLGVGAYSAALLRLHAGLGGLPAAALGAVAAAVLGYLVGFGAARLRPAFTALATWAFAWLLVVAIDAAPQVSGGGAGIGLHGPMGLRLGALGIDARFDARGHLLLATVLLALTLTLARAAQRSVLGLGWAAMRGSPALARALGHDVARRRRAVLLVGAGLAGLGGALAAQTAGAVDPAAYSPLVSLSLFAAVLLGSPYGLLGPFIGLAVTRGLQAVLDGAAAGSGFPLEPAHGIVTALVTGAALALVLGSGRRLGGRRFRPAAAIPEADQETPTPAASASPRQPAAGPSRALETAGEPAPQGHDLGRLGAGSVPPQATGPAAPQPLTPHSDSSEADFEAEPSAITDPGPPPQPEAPALEARGLSLRAGGIAVLDRVDLAVEAGEILGLVGPRGAGKSTLLRCLSGAVRPDAGRVRLDGRRLDGLDEVARAQAGVVRTFQQPQVLPDLSVVEHVELGLARGAEATSWIQAVAKTPAYRDAARRRRQAARALLGVGALEDLAGADPETLSAGRRRLLQVIAAAASGPEVLLLDQPSTGMARDELPLLQRTLLRLRRYGLTLVVAEPDLRLLGGLADRVVVLHRGRVIAEGPTAEVAGDPAVRQAYLGVEEGQTWEEEEPEAPEPASPAA